MTAGTLKRILLMLTLRPIGPDDYSVHDDGQYIGRIRYARERSPGIWLWHITRQHLRL